MALVATGFFSFGLWVHHMFATGIPELSLAFFSAASMAVAIPSGIQVFAWIATIAAGRLRLTVPSLFVLGFLAIFVIGGLTGVMVAMVPFDWQAHDTYFIVAHLHYVLFGGMVFPLFAAIYYWAPALSSKAAVGTTGPLVIRPAVHRLQRDLLSRCISPASWACRGGSTPIRRTWGGTGSTLSVDRRSFHGRGGRPGLPCRLAVQFRFAMSGNAGNVWRAGTLEWLPNDVYGTRSIPRGVESRPAMG